MIAFARTGLKRAIDQGPLSNCDADSALEYWKERPFSPSCIIAIIKRDDCFFARTGLKEGHSSEPLSNCDADFGTVAVMDPMAAVYIYFQLLFSEFLFLIKTLISNGWKTFGKETLKEGHSSGPFSNCDADSGTVAVMDPMAAVYIYLQAPFLHFGP
ncbi:hypothetical protein CEXT_351401 [Caerostris extrusa]|uniref:Glutaminase n=1 Tax=Caerostris extrusa TaxID=172846 RepID=A0AAV4RMN4_CAEEX|nr:hypothetical protein CEXT_351401 [Caerostris extrusa]